MNPLMPYYRRQISIALGVGITTGYLLGDWLTGAISGVALLAGSLWAPRSGHYVVDPSRGAAALYEDERSRTIRARATEVAFQVVLVAACMLWYVVRSSGRDALSHVWLASLVVLGVATQIASDYYLRRYSHGDMELPPPQGAQ